MRGLQLRMRFSGQAGTKNGAPGGAPFGRKNRCSIGWLVYQALIFILSTQVE